MGAVGAVGGAARAAVGVMRVALTATAQGRSSSQTKDPDKIGQAGNSKVNTTHQGYQQDR